MRLVTAAILGFLLPGAGLALWKSGVHLTGAPDIWRPLGIGLVVGVITWIGVFVRTWSLDTFVHEWTHAAASMLFLRRIRQFMAGGDGQGGYVQHSGGTGGQFGDDFIGLAPYFFAPGTLLFFCLRPIIQPDWLFWYDGFLGVSLGIHLASAVQETMVNWSDDSFRSAATGEWTQTDIARRGFIFSGLYIAAMNLLFIGLMAVLLRKGWGGIPDWARAVPLKSLDIFKGAVDTLPGLVKEALARIRDLLPG